MLVNNAFAQATGAVATGSVTGMLVQLFLIFAVFYFILIRPQQKKIRAHEDMLNAIKRGDKVITGGGIFAVVEKADEEKLEVKIAEGVIVKVHRATIRDVVDEKAENSVVKTETKNKRK